MAITETEARERLRQWAADKVNRYHATRTQVLALLAADSVYTAGIALGELARHWREWQDAEDILKALVGMRNRPYGDLERFLLEMAQGQLQDLINTRPWGWVANVNHIQFSLNGELAAATAQLWPEFIRLLETLNREIYGGRP